MIPSFVRHAVAVAALIGLAALSYEVVGSLRAAKTSSASHQAVDAVSGFVPNDLRPSDCGVDDSCLRQAFGNVVAERGPRKALMQLEAGISSREIAEEACHGAAHQIGEMTLAQLRDAGAALARGSSICGSGYYHGVLSQALRAAKDGDVVEVARHLCDEVQPIVGVEPCGHGLGHGLMAYYGYDLLRSLRLCDQLSGHDTFQCQNGVFMSYFVTPVSANSTKSAVDPLHPCGRLAHRYRRECYREVTSVARVRGAAWSDLTVACRDAEREFREACVEGVARLYGRRYSTDPQAISVFCTQQGAFARACTAQAAGIVAGMYATAARAADVCVAARAAFRTECFRIMGNVLSAELDEAELRTTCNRFAGRYSRTCWQNQEQ